MRRTEPFGRLYVNLAGMRKVLLALALLSLAAAAAADDEVFEKAFSMEGVSGVSVENVNGSIELKDIFGPVRATTVNGSVRIVFRGPLKDSRIETVNGSVDVAFARASSIRYNLETVNGRIEGDFELAVEGKFGPKEARGS